MMVVLLKNKTRELRCYNVGDSAVRVERQVPARTKSGQTGYRTEVRKVSSSVTLPPGEWVRVPGIILKQSAVKRDIAKGVLQHVAVTGDDAPAAVPGRAVMVAAAAPLKNDKGSHPVEEDGRVEVGKHKKADA